MRVMVIVKATADSEAGLMPAPDLVAAMGRFNEDLAAAGLLLAGEGVQPSSKGVRIAFDGPARSLAQGPFFPSEDLLAGFWLWQVKDLDEAVAWARRCPNPMPGPSVIEIRPLYEEADFA
ncbi:YciI family protein [Zavarzinia compransoris]|uniref:YCII-related domain-containing protein n=1 Tax=Zavarzinia compransoris TaxID=1264899 RepID=A0A317DZ70_9PROT|nr:YciI family protein [Zavarzinia compransoris]PWR19176.1 hypothetical protein DKG75_19690 [Zavarzinia compransoris]TDP49192.1 hypothetical protein DES42_101560 [Zavarzinia compransoris]